MVTHLSLGYYNQEIFSIFIRLNPFYNPGKSPDIKVLTLIVPSKSLLPARGNISQNLWTLWGRRHYSVLGFLLFSELNTWFISEAGDTQSGRLWEEVWVSASKLRLPLAGSGTPCPAWTRQCSCPTPCMMTSA